MALKTIVKIGSVSNLSDARYGAGMGVDMLGFNVRPGDPESISYDDYKEIAGWVSGVRLVGELHGSDIDTILRVSGFLEFDAVEVDNPEICLDLSLKGIPVLLRLDLMEGQVKNLRSVMEYCTGAVDYFLLEVHKNFSVGTQNALTALSRYYPVLLSGDLTSDQILNWVDSLPVQGIALKGSKEIKPGFKDYDELGDILEALEVDDLA